MILLLLILAVPAVVSAQNPVEIIRRATELDRRNTEISRSYTFLERQEQRDVNAAGKLTKTESTTVDVTLLEGSPYRRLVARNDQPLSPKDQRKEQEKLQKSIEDRRKETWRCASAGWRTGSTKAETTRAAGELPEAFTQTHRGRNFNGGEVFVIEGLPKPGYYPKSASTAFFTKIKLHMWIDKKDYQWVKVDLESLDTITFGGILLRLAKGSHVTIENARVNN